MDADLSQRVERLVLDVAREILMRRNVALSDDFIELGADSLDVLVLAQRIEDEFGDIDGLDRIYSMTSLQELVDAVVADRGPAER